MKNNNNNTASKRRRREAGIPPSPRGHMRHQMEQQQVHAKVDPLQTTTSTAATAAGDDVDADKNRHKDDEDEEALLSFMFIGTDVRYPDNQMEASVLQSDSTIIGGGGGGGGSTVTRRGNFSHESLKKVVVMDESGRRLGGRILCVSWSTDYSDDDGHHTEGIEEEEEDGDVDGKGKGAAIPATTTNTTAAAAATTNQANQSLNNNNNDNPHMKLSLADIKRFDTPILAMCIINLPLHIVEDQPQGVPPPSSSLPSSSLPAPPLPRRGRVRLIVSTGRHLVSYPILRNGKLGSKLAVVCTDRPMTFLHWHSSNNNSNNNNNSSTSAAMKGHVVGTDGKNGVLVWQYHAGDERPSVVVDDDINNKEQFVLRAVDTEVRTHCLGALFINNTDNNNTDDDDENNSSNNNDKCSKRGSRFVLADGNGSLSIVRPERRIGKLVYLGNTTRYNTGSIATKLLPQGFKFGTTTTTSSTSDGNSNTNNNFSLVCGDGRVVQFATSVPYDDLAKPLWKLQSYMARHPLTAPLSGCDYQEHMGGRVVGVPGRGVSLLRHPIMVKEKKEEGEGEEGKERKVGEMEEETHQEPTTTDASASVSGDGQQPLADALNGALTLTGGSCSIDTLVTTTPIPPTTTPTADEVNGMNTNIDSTVVGDLILDLNMLQLYEQLPYRDQVDLAMAVVNTDDVGEGRGNSIEREKEKEEALSMALLYVEWMLDLIYKARQYVS